MIKIIGNNFYNNNDKYNGRVNLINQPPNVLNLQDKFLLLVIFS